MTLYVKLKKQNLLLSVQKPTPPILSQSTGSQDNLEMDRFVNHEGKKNPE